MDRFVDKIREIVEKVIPLAIVGLLGYGGWHLYKEGTFRHGLKPAVGQIVSKIPYFGSRFRHYISGSSNSYVAGRASYRGQKHQGRRRGGRHFNRRNRRHR